ncbi:phosphatase PAP2 family protein [Bacteriovorax sp. Seq25_V]|uniref:phosphatase PAP2 family protein n=1 Tax=Bacteriovorax sp. Seq25_V TaxID=1201288 RepID=UPI00038A4808|nr:phosphatase PAP2 family protein [Bacteriovorax sp. Seq25_V]EQC44904.1 PAP2 family protein [Bacteriovorax sp. Seq25_V]
MFESKIQKAWQDYRGDFGLGRIGLWVSLFEVFIFFICLLFFEAIIIEPLLPVILILFLISLEAYIHRLRNVHRFLINTLFLTCCIIFNYVFVGTFDKLAGGLTRYDLYFADLDLQILGLTSAAFFLKVTSFLGPLQSLYYDFLQLSYMTYFLFPFLGGIFYYQQLSERNKYKIGRFFASLMIFFFFNFLLYVLVPVSGPQYFLASVKELSLPLSAFGVFFNNIVLNSHPNFIDCFPSGHTGISVLVTIWMFKIKNHYRYIFLLFCVGMIQATLALKYHYLLDVLCAFPFAFICYKLAYFIVPIDIDIRRHRKWRF